MPLRLAMAAGLPDRRWRRDDLLEKTGGLSLWG